LPPAEQRVPADVPDLLRRRLAERTVNVTGLPNIITAANGGQFELTVPRSLAVASTTDGRYYLRVADQSKPVTGDDVMRLASERAALPWETQISLQIPRSEVEAAKVDTILAGLRASDRVKSSVKEKTSNELLDHYLLAQGEYLTNLGILCVGEQFRRAQLATAPVIQFIKFDDHGQKVNKIVWDDHTLRSRLAGGSRFQRVVRIARWPLPTECPGVRRNCSSRVAGQRARTQALHLTGRHLPQPPSGSVGSRQSPGYCH